MRMSPGCSYFAHSFFAHDPHGATVLLWFPFTSSLWLPTSCLPSCLQTSLCSWCTSVSCCSSNKPSYQSGAGQRDQPSCWQCLLLLRETRASGHAGRCPRDETVQFCHFTDEEMDAERGCVMCQWLENRFVIREPGAKLRFSVYWFSVITMGYVGAEMVVAELKQYKWKNRKGHLMEG